MTYQTLFTIQNQQEKTHQLLEFYGNKTEQFAFFENSNDFPGITLQPIDRHCDLGVQINIQDSVTPS